MSGSEMMIQQRSNLLMEELALKAKADKVPANLPFNQDDWDAMPVDERLAALQFFRAEAQASTKGLAIDFPRIGYPTSGMKFWQITTPQGEVKPEKSLKGVVIFHLPSRVYYPSFETQQGTPPTCVSDDGIVPNRARSQEVQSMTCAECPHSQWNTGKDGRGMACKLRTRVFMLLEGEEIPTLISLPPTAVKPFSQYVVSLLKANIPAGLLGVVTELGLHEETNPGGQKYQKLECRAGRPLAYKEMLRADALRNVFKQQMELLGQTVVESNTDD